MTKERYDRWIEGWLSQNMAYGNCESATIALVESFPELEHIRGHVLTTWGKREHHWAVTKDGDIVDPTASQFDGIFGYEVWKPGDELRVGKCMNCGEEIWESVESLDAPKRSKSICSENCEKEYELYMIEECGEVWNRK